MLHARNFSWPHEISLQVLLTGKSIFATYKGIPWPCLNFWSANLELQVLLTSIHSAGFGFIGYAPVGTHASVSVYSIIYVIQGLLMSNCLMTFLWRFMTIALFTQIYLPTSICLVSYVGRLFSLLTSLWNRIDMPIKENSWLVKILQEIISFCLDTRVVYNWFSMSWITWVTLVQSHTHQSFWSQHSPLINQLLKK